jgi:2-methylcitrate dehydratase PrpD
LTEANGNKKMKPSIPATDILAEFVSEHAYSDLPDTVVHKAKLWFLDAIGCGLGGSQSQLAKTAVEALSQISTGNAKVVGQSVDVSIGTAAFLNAMSINALDYDDSSSGGHVSSTLVGTLLAMLCQNNYDGKSFLLSYILGYEVSVRITNAIAPSPARFAEVWGLGTQQTFGAVTAAAKINQLSKGQVRNAFGIAGASAPVPSAQKWNWDNRPLTWMKDAVAYPAQIGITAATLAASGFIGCRDILDGSMGFWRMASSDQCDFDLMIDGLGEKYLFMDNSIKTYSCCWFIHPTLDALGSLVKRHNLVHQDIAQIDVWSLTDLYEMFNFIEPGEMVDAQFSLPYCVALSLLEVQTGPEWFNRKLFNNEDVLSIGSRVKIHPDSECDRIFHEESRRISARVAITTVNGNRYEESAPAPRGTPLVPISDDEIIEKYLKMAIPVLGNEKADKLKQLILRIESEDSLLELPGLIAT